MVAGKYIITIKPGYLIESANESGPVLFTRDAKGRTIKEDQNGYLLKQGLMRLGRKTDMTTSLGAYVKMERNPLVV